MSDVLTDVDTVITDNWTSGSTDDRTPTIATSSDASLRKRRDTFVSDYILLRSINYISYPNSIGTVSKKTEDLIEADVLTSWSSSTVAQRAHSIKVRDELERILDNKILAIGNHDILEVSGLTIQDKAHWTPGLGRWVFTFKVLRLNQAR